MQNPLGSRDDIVKIAQVVARKVERLVKNTIGRELPISYLTIFSHHQHEYNRFVEWTSELGTKSEANNGLKFALKEPIKTHGGDINLIRIRKPDPYRSQIGCADLIVEDYKAFKLQELSKHSDNLRLIERPEFEMLEFFDLESNNVLAYVVSK